MQRWYSQYFANKRFRMRLIKTQNVDLVCASSAYVFGCVLLFELRLQTGCFYSLLSIFIYTHTYQYTHTCRSGAPYRVLRATYTDANWTFKVSFWHSETYNIQKRYVLNFEMQLLIWPFNICKRMKMKNFFCAQDQIISESNLNLDHKWMTLELAKLTLHFIHYFNEWFIETWYFS